MTNRNRVHGHVCAVASPVPWRRDDLWSRSRNLPVAVARRPPSRKCAGGASRDRWICDGPWHPPRNALRRRTDRLRGHHLPSGAR